MSLPRFPLYILALSAGMLAAPNAVRAGDHDPVVIHSVRNAVSAPMRDIIRDMPPPPPMNEEDGEPFQVPNIFIKPNRAVLNRAPDLEYPGIQRMPRGVPAPTVDISFDAIDQISSNCGCLPPDTNGDVDEQYYIQWVNGSWAVYDKVSGALVSGPTPGNSFWAGFGGKCETTNSGDPLVVYDQVAGRWVMSQFVTSTPFAQCVAVSTSSDPLGTYYQYEFQWPNRFGDYGKLGVWTDESGTQDAYLLTTHEFNGSGTSFFGAALIAMERDKMLVGDPAAMIRYPGYDAYGVQPLNLIGTVKAPANACPSYVHFDETASDYVFWDLCLDWTDPLSSVITPGGSPIRVPAGEPFSPFFDSVRQPGTGSVLDSFGSNVMYRATARAFPADAPMRMALVINHVVQAATAEDGSAIGGVRWIEFGLGDSEPPPSVPTGLSKRIIDEGVMAPDDDTRWMGGIAIDASGNIGLGYSVSSTETNPQIRVTGRTAGDPPGTMRDEQTCTDGFANGSQTSASGRWGDYSSMNVDPSDQCTFWFTTEYYPTTSSANWHTRVCSFKFPDCGNPDFALVATSDTRIEMCGATAAGDPEYDLRAGVLNGFSGPVNLSLVNAPAGTSGAFSPNPVNAPGTSALTLTNGAALVTGEYEFRVDGTDGTITRSLDLELGISEHLPEQPGLLTPVDVATGVKIRPVLNWGTVADPGERVFADGFDGVVTPLPGPPSTATSYTVEVASDAGFATIVASAEVTEQHWTVDVSLDPSTTYYWRVIAHNYCGDSVVSDTFSFTTGIPGECPAGTTASTVFEDDFSNGTNGWTTTGSGSTDWSQGAPPAGIGFSGTVWKIPDNPVPSDRSLDSPAIAIPDGVAAVILSYDAFHKFEDGGPDACYDNASMALSNDGGANFGYLGPERMFTDSYNGIALSTTALGGNYVWCFPGSGGSTAPTHAVVDLDDYAGETVQIRFRAASDPNTTAPAPNGMVIANFKVEVCQ
jgi:hypothetical protein